MSRVHRHPPLVLIMGVAGSGKSTIGRLLAAKLACQYFEADDFHPPANIAKMSRGEPLNDLDRTPWLARIRARMERCREESVRGVFTCSALKAAYRRVLIDGLEGVLVVYLQADLQTIAARVSKRRDHFMKADLVCSQFEALEPPGEALTVDARTPPEEIVRLIHVALSH